MQTAHFSNDHFHRVRSVLKRGFNINIVWELLRDANDVFPMPNKAGA